METSNSDLEKCTQTNSTCKSEPKMLNSITNIPLKEKVGADHSSRSSSIVSASSRKHKSPVNKENRVKGSSRQEIYVQNGCASVKSTGWSENTVCSSSGNSKSKNEKRVSKTQSAELKSKLNGEAHSNGNEPQQPSSHSSSATSSTERPKKGNYLFKKKTK